MGMLLRHTTQAPVHVQFNGLYEAAIDGAERAALPAKRIAAIIDHMTFEIYKYIQRGLFERHKLIFAWMLTASILVSAGKARPPSHQTRDAGSSCNLLFIGKPPCSPRPASVVDFIQCSWWSAVTHHHAHACRSRRMTSTFSCAAAGRLTSTASARSPRCTTQVSALHCTYELSIIELASLA